MSKKLKIILPIAMVLIIAGLLVFYFISRRMPSNPPESRGNTAGNLISGGTFCEYGDKIYFSNPYDQGRLYTMDTNCNNIERQSTDSVSYINACGKFLYYIRDNSASTGGSNSVIFRGQNYGVVRTRLDGSKETTLYNEFCTDLALAGNSLIFNANDGTVLSTFSMSTDGGEPDLVYRDNFLNASITWNELTNTHLLFHSSKQTNHSVYALGLETGSRDLYLQGNTYMATEYNGSIYYIDLDNNYALTCVNIAAGTKTVLTKEKVVLYNIYDNLIFIQTETKKDHHALLRMNLDGSNPEEVVQGDIISINCTSKYTFITMYDAPEILYRIPTRNGNTVETFYITYN